MNALVTNFTFNLRGLSIGLSIWRRRRWNNRGRSCWLNDIRTQLIALLSLLAFYICLDFVRNDCTFGFNLVLSVLTMNALVTNFTFNLRGLSTGLSIWRRRRWNNRGRSRWLNDIGTQLIALLSVLAFYICIDCVRNDCTFHCSFTGFLNLFRFWSFFSQLTGAYVILRSFHFGLSRRGHYWKRVINLSFFFPGFIFRFWPH